MALPMTPEDIAALLHNEGSGLSADDYDETTEPAEVRHRRTEMLAPVLTACQQAWFSGSGQIDFIAEKLADGSRDVAWRGPMGDSGILQFFLDGLAVDGLRQSLLIHSLRLVGNSCADTDENRERVVQGNHIPSVMKHLHDHSLIPFTIPVLYNILVDYDPAQMAASQCHLNQHLTTLLQSPSLPTYAPFIPLFCKILCLLSSQEGEEALANPMTVHIALTLATATPYRDDPEDFVSFASVAIAYLAKESFQESVISSTAMQMFLDVFHTAANFDPNAIEDEDVAAQLKQQRPGLMTVLADLTARDSAFAYHPMASSVSQNLWAWLHTPNRTLQAAACIAMGNMSRSDEVSIALVRSQQAYAPLAKLLSDPSVHDTQLLHAALGFLKNLAIPPQNKSLLNILLEPSCVPRIFSLDTQPQVQFAAVSLTRLLLVNCPENVRQLCAPLSSDPSSPAHERTSVHALISLFERSDAEPTRLEAARAIAAMCRVFHTVPALSVLPDWNLFDESAYQRSASASPGSTPSMLEVGSDEDSLRRKSFYASHRLKQVLSLLVTQEKWPIVRSEAWFVFALMCRSRDGASMVLTVLQVHAASNSLIEAITGQKTAPDTPNLAASRWEDETSAAGSSRPSTRRDREVASMADDLELEPQQVDPGQKANTTKVDRENAVVLCTTMIKTAGEDLPEMRANLLQDLIKQGTELIAAEKAQG